MKFSEKIIRLRKSQGMSQEELAEGLNLSRQAISRWENGTAMPDAENIVQLSRLFNVSTDYLLLEDFEEPSRKAPPPPVPNPTDSWNHVLPYLIGIEVMGVLIQAIMVINLEHILFAFLGFCMFVSCPLGFELGYRKHPPTKETAAFRRKFYKISAWLGAYFPVRMAALVAIAFLEMLDINPGFGISQFTFEVVVLVVYIAIGIHLSHRADEAYFSRYS